MNLVAIYSDPNFSKELDYFYPLEVIVTNSSRVIKAPVEGGAMSFDNKVIDPIVIKIIGKFMLNDNGSYQDIGSILTMFESREFSFYSCTTKDTAYGNLILQNVVSREESSEFDIGRYELEFVEALVIQGGGRKTKKSENSNYVAQGNKNPVKVE